MTAPKNLNDKVEGFREAVLLIEKNLKYIESLALDKFHLQSYRKILSYLSNRSESEIFEILDNKQIKKKPLKTESSQLPDLYINKLDNESLKRLVVTQKFTRSTLERIATVRFSVPKGSLPIFRTRDALIQKILTLLAHEDTHDAISRAAAKDNPIEASAVEATNKKTER